MSSKHYIIFKVQCDLNIISNRAKIADLGYYYSIVVFKTQNENTYLCYFDFNGFTAPENVKKVNSLFKISNCS